MINTINKQDRLLDPRETFKKLKDTEATRWYRLFCKILIAKSCEGYYLKTCKKQLIEVIVVNKYGWQFKVSGGSWNTICIMLGKFMLDYFEIEGHKQMQAKIKRIKEALRK